MANENKNINELVDDDDPTVELEVASFPEAISEADERTYDAAEDDNAGLPDGVSVSELKSDLLKRKETINKLQYDIQQLHSKWVGLESEISAREDQTAQLNTELASASKALARKKKLLKKRDRSIKSLKSEIRERDEAQRKLADRCEEYERALADAKQSLEKKLTPATSEHGLSVSDLEMRLDQSESYADAIRVQLQDLIESHADAEREIEHLSSSLEAASQKNSDLVDAQSKLSAELDAANAQLAAIQGQHEEEIRNLRFELGEAQNTMVEAEDMNNQLASELVDAQGFKVELEKMLSDVEGETNENIAKLEKENAKLSRANKSLEEKLTAKSEAITVLLAELAKKSEQMDTFGEIEDVIHDMDERMSERSAVRDDREQKPPAERLSRVLIGTVDDQVLRFPLFKDRLTIGRTKDNDIQLAAAYISRRHAVIQTDEDITRIIDWGSKNGIFINGEKIDEHFLKHGDAIEIGNARFRYEELKKRDA